MDDLLKHGITVGLIAAGVLTAGYVMKKFPTAPIVSDARAGYSGT